MQLIERCKRDSRGAVVPSQGATYMVIGVLLAKGLVRSWVEQEPRPESGGRPRRYYELTAKGRKRANADRAMVAALMDCELEPPAADGPS